MSEVRRGSSEGHWWNEGSLLFSITGTYLNLLWAMFADSAFFPPTAVECYLLIAEDKYIPRLRKNSGNAVLGTCKNRGLLLFL